MKDGIIIAIDGFSSCGKSSLAKDLAKSIGYRYIDSGAMYRAVSLYCIHNSIDISDIDEVNNVLKEISIEFQLVQGQNHCFLNGKDVELEIRTMEVANIVSHIAAISSVRTYLVEQQRKMGLEKSIIMDGRDIGTVVFPHAELKIFLVAEPHIRILRRYEEMINKKMETSLEEVEDNLSKRDHIDSTREDSPLRRAEDAIVLDNSKINHQEQLALAIKMYESVVE